MIIIKKANAYSCYFGPLECDCQKLIQSEDGLPYCEVVFKIRRENIPPDQPVFTYILNLFSQICMDKAYFIPHFYFRVKDILLLSEHSEESLLFDLDIHTLQKLHQMYFFTGHSQHWQLQWQRTAGISSYCQNQ